MMAPPLNPWRTLHADATADAEPVEFEPTCPHCDGLEHAPNDYCWCTCSPHH